MAKVIDAPVESGGNLVFKVEHAGRSYTMTVKGTGGIEASGDLGAFNNLVETVRRYAAEHEQDIPESFRTSRDLFPTK